MLSNLTPTVRAILIANVLVFAASFLPELRPIIDRLALWPLHSANPDASLPFAPWQLVTYGFVHLEFFHLFTNMFAMYMFGPDVERLLGSRRFQLFYGVCVVGAALAQEFVTATIHPTSVATVGASGGIFGLLLCFGMAFPQRKLMLLFPPIPMPAWLFVTLYGVLELYLGVFGLNQGVAHFAHLGGMAAGYLLILYWRTQARQRRLS
jgi:membrane associated rhomboid family serine protease